MSDDWSGKVTRYSLQPRNSTSHLIQSLKSARRNRVRRRVDRLTYDTQQEANTRLSRDAEEDRTRSVDTRPSLARSGAADAFTKFW